MKWISVKDKLPDCGEYYRSDLVIIYREDEYMGAAFYSTKTNEWSTDACCCNDIDGIIYWMPFPEKPIDKGE